MPSLWLKGGKRTFTVFSELKVICISSVKPGTPRNTPGTSHNTPEHPPNNGEHPQNTKNSGQRSDRSHID